MHVINSSLSLSSAVPPGVSVTTSQADPRPPQLIGCVFLERANVTCRWEAGDTPTTHYTLQLHMQNDNKCVKCASVYLYMVCSTVWVIQVFSFTTLY